MIREQLADLLRRALAELRERLARERRGHDRQFAHDPLRGYRVDLDEGRLDEGVQLVVERACALVVARLERVV
jgi:hypothetical protein